MRQTFGGAIPSSFGMDFIEVKLDRAARRKPLAITFQGQGQVTRFNVQVWTLGPGYARPRALTPEPEIVADSHGEAQVFAIPPASNIVPNRLALIITRLDADEALDDVGAYEITLDSGEIDG